MELDLSNIHIQIQKSVFTYDVLTEEIRTYERINVEV